MAFFLFVSLDMELIELYKYQYDSMSVQHMNSIIF